MNSLSSLWVSSLTDLTRRGLSVFGYPSSFAAFAASKPNSDNQPTMRNVSSSVDEDGRVSAIGLDISFEDDHGLTQSQQDEFVSDFAGDLGRLTDWANAHRWVISLPPTLRVVVSPRFKISKSLVPAWYGRAGEMEFPAWRVASRRAAIAHELAHVFFPNANRLLAEGFAIHLQAELGGNHAFPNFGKPLHVCARERALEIGFEPLHLAELDSIATPSPLQLAIGSAFYGEEVRGQSCLYAFAGSFAQFLIETQGIATFRKLYLQTPMIPLQQNAGLSVRWTGVYPCSLAELAGQWKSAIDGRNQ